MQIVLTTEAARLEGGTQEATDRAEAHPTQLGSGS